MKQPFHKINLNDFKLTKTKKIEKAISHLNENGDLIKDKHYPLHSDITNIENLGSPDDFSNMDRKRKLKKVKAKRKNKKGCSCK